VIAMLIAILAVVLIVPAISAAVARNVMTNFDRRPSPGSIDQSLVEARLTRIEEAIDAMAVQIEKLSEHQRSLLGPAASDTERAT
jgi:hypothetical protein